MKIAFIVLLFFCLSFSGKTNHEKEASAFSRMIENILVKKQHVSRASPLDTLFICIKDAVHQDMGLDSQFTIAKVTVPDKNCRKLPLLEISNFLEKDDKIQFTFSLDQGSKFVEYECTYYKSLDDYTYRMLRKSIE